MEKNTRSICHSCKAEIAKINKPLSPMTVAFDFEKYRIAYCRSCAEKVNKALSRAIENTFEG